MRRLLADTLYEEMKTNDKIFLLVGDLGYKVFDQHFKDFPDRCLNCGASEQAMIGIAVGLALEGKIPFVYTITPFLIYRAYETLRLYLHHEHIPVKLIGSGRDNDYSHDGISHDATGVDEVLNTVPNIVQMWPQTKEDVPSILRVAITNNRPTFISLKR